MRAGLLPGQTSVNGALRCWKHNGLDGSTESGIRRLATACTKEMALSDKLNLSTDDVARLLKDPSEENRAVTAQKISANFGPTLSDSERAIAEDIFQIMVNDAAVRVRAALSDSLKDNPEIPHDVALKLAHDVEEVALPMIEFSAVLDDGDLEELIASQGADYQMAVAKRPVVSETVSEALAKTRNEKVVATLVANEGAKIAEGTMNKVLDEFGDSELVNKPMALRHELPLTVAERLVTLVSDNLRTHILTHHELSANYAADLVLQAREKATVSLLDREDESTDVAALVKQLNQNHRLTPTLLMRALCMGDMAFFEAGMAERADIPVVNAYKLIHDKGDLGIKALFERCGFSASLVKIARAALKVIAETDYDGGDHDIERFKHRMIERVLTQFEQGFDQENLDYLIAKLGNKALHAGH
jgi:uncharacterized protein (DUF2336 family)